MNMTITNDGWDSLTEIEKKILRHASQGKDNAFIGEQLYISKDTVKAHFKSIFDKLNAINRTHAIYIAVKHNLID